MTDCSSKGDTEHSARGIVLEDHGAEIWLSRQSMFLMMPAPVLGMAED
jgi:hypothetical protein